MSEIVIETHGLTKRYGGAVAVAGIDLSVVKGEVLGLLGPNGAGKTTTILMLLGLTESSEGEVRVLGLDPLRQPLEVKRAVGYLPDQMGFYDSMTGIENLAYTARLSGMANDIARERIVSALDKVRLGDVGNNRVSTYSRGMRQRLGIAELLVRDASIMILDEPTSALDPQSTEELLSLIRDLSREGMTVLLSSHMLDVVQSVCNRVALFNGGRIGFVGTIDELAAKIGGGAFVVDVEAEGVDLEKLIGKEKTIKAVSSPAPGKWQVEATGDVRARLAKLVVEAGGSLANLGLRRSRLDDAYRRFFEEVCDAA